MSAQPPNRNNPGQPPPGRGPGASSGRGGQLPNWTPPRDQGPKGKAPQGKPQRPAVPPPPPPPRQQKVGAPTQVHFACPACMQPFSMPAKAAGRKARCPCGARVLVPPPGGVPRALYMPSEEAQKAAQQRVRESGGKNAAEIALESSPTKVAMYVGVLLALVIGFFVWKRSNESSASEEPSLPSAPTDDGAPVSTGDATGPDLVKRFGPSVALIEAVDEEGQPVGTGCGFIVASGRTATTFSLALGAANLRVKLPEGNIVAASGLAWLDAGLDVAVATMELGELPPVPLGDSDKVAAGEKVFLIGPKAGFENEFRESRIEKAAAAAGQPARLTGGVSAANAGAPVFNLAGLVVGVAVLLPDGGSGMAPINPLKPALDAPKTRPFSEVSAAAAQRPAADILRDARRLMANGRSRVAMQLLERASARDGAGPELLVALGDALLVEDRPRAARRRFEEAARAKTGWAAQSGIGQGWLFAGETEIALATLRGAVAAGGAEDATTVAALALALARLGDAPRAKAAAQKALALGSASRRALHLAALAFATAKDESSAKQALDALQKLRPDEAFLLAARGDVALLLGNADRAQELFDNSKAAGGGARALVGRGHALQALGQGEAALTAWKEAVNARGNGEGTWWVLAQGCEAAGQLDEAAAQYRNMLAADPADADANAGIGRVLLAADPARALPHLKQAMEARPEGRRFVFDYVKGCRAVGDGAGAAKALADFLARVPGDATARIELALLKAQDAPEEALKLVDGLAVAGTLAGRAAYARGQALLELDRSAEARAAFELAISHDPGVGDYRYARALAAEGESVHEALAAWESFLAWAKKVGDNAERIERVITRLRERYGR